MDNSDLTLAGIAITVLMGLGAAIYKASSMRGNIHREWSQRVDTTIAGLEELALTQLYAIRGELDQWAHRAEEYWPEGFLPNPFSLSSLVRRYEKSLRYRQRMEPDLKKLMAIGPAFLIALVMAFVAVVLMSVYHLDVAQLRTIQWLGYVLAAVAFTTLIIALIAYSTIQHRMTSAESFTRRLGQDV